MVFVFITFSMFVGVLFKKISANFSNVDYFVRTLLSRYVIFVILPAIIVLKLPQLELELSLLLPLLVCWGLIFIGWAIIKFLSERFKWSRSVEGTMLLITLFGNTSFVGFPIISAFYGEQALGFAVLYDQLGSFLSLAVVGNLVVAIYGDNLPKSDKKYQVFKVVLMKVISFPPFVAIVFAFVISDIPLPEELTSILTLISQTLIPSTMILVGYFLVFSLPPQLKNALVMSLCIKMIAFPVLTFLFFLITHQSGLIAKVTLMESAMPTMVSASILAIDAKLETRLASASVGYGLLLAIIVMPTIFYVSNML